MILILLICLFFYSQWSIDTPSVGILCRFVGFSGAYLVIKFAALAAGWIK